MPHSKRPVLAASVAALVAAFFGALIFVGPAVAGVYDSAVLADAPSAYWRLGEPDGATTAADASGHGVTLTYTSAALLDTLAGLNNETDTSLAADGSTVASRSPAGVSDPGMLEMWMRTNVPASSATIYYLQTAAGGSYTLTVGTDGLLHATIVPGGPCCNPTVTMVGPSNKQVTDGLWHYITVDFANWYIYVDLTQGPQGTTGGGFGSQKPFALGSITLGGANFRGQLDEVAVYDTPLSASRMSAHATAGGLGWDSQLSVGGEEGSPPGCPEFGLFHKGSRVNTNSANPADNYTAYGALNYITTTFQSTFCGLAPLPPPYSTLRPTFVSGQTVRVKTNDGIENYYAEWGPIQYYCNPTTICYGLFFNFKAQEVISPGPPPVVAGPNDVCWVPFSASDAARLTLENCPTPGGAALSAIQSCSPTGTHGWKIQHEASNWVTYFACDTTPPNPTWVQVFSHSDYDSNLNTHWTHGWPDMEAFSHRYACLTTRDCPTKWRREGFMVEQHSNFQYATSDGGAAWTSTMAYTVCRKDTSYRWDGARVGTGLPITWHIVEDPTHTVGCKP